MKRYGLSLALFALFAASWAGQWLAQWDEFAAEQRAHGQTADAPSFLPTFLSATMENWQSEFLQLLTFVLLSTYLIHKGSPQSRDGQDASMAKLDEILARLEDR